MLEDWILNSFPVQSVSKLTNEIKTKGLVCSGFHFCSGQSTIKALQGLYWPIVFIWKPGSVVSIAKLNMQLYPPPWYFGHVGLPIYWISRLLSGIVWGLMRKSKYEIGVNFKTQPYGGNVLTHRNFTRKYTSNPLWMLFNLELGAFQVINFDVIWK